MKSKSKSKPATEIAAAMAVSLLSPSYYPLTLFVPSNIGVRRRRSAAVQLQCLGLHGSFDVEQHSQNSRKHWDEFYERHQNKFFKDRHYLEKDWGKYFCDDNNIIPSDGKIMLELDSIVGARADMPDHKLKLDHHLHAGCGAGNTLFPLAMKYPRLFLHACDFSQHAIRLVKSHTKFREDQMNVFVCNIEEEDSLCDHIMPSSVDIVTLIFTLSAISPKKMPVVIQNLGRVLKPNGHVLFRDYAIGDYAQEMLMNKNQVISENFYFRGDGTSSFYFSEDLLSDLFVRAGFMVVDVDTYAREIKNRSRNITMQRLWIRAAFKRP